MAKLLTAGAVALAIATAWPATALAKNQAPRACTAAFTAAREREQLGQLRSARWFLLQCAKASCGGLERRCASAAGHLASSIASVAPVVTDSAGAPLVDVSVKVDGEQVATHLDGRGLAIDPGVHELAFSAHVGASPGRDVTVTRKMMIVEGQRGPINIELPSAEASEPKPAPVVTDAAEVDAPDPPAAPQIEETPASTAPTAKRGGPSPAAYVLGGAGLLALGAGGLFTLWGQGDNNALGACSPNCAPASVDHVKTMYIVADVSFGVGAAALAVSALLFATSHHVSDAPASASAARSKHAFVFGLAPARAGGVASIGGTF